jgi:hypothetical protein
VKRIVIVSKDKTSDEILAKLLSVLFPECEIITITKKMTTETLSNGSLRRCHRTESQKDRESKD